MEMDARSRSSVSVALLRVYHLFQMPFDELALSPMLCGGQAYAWAQLGGSILLPNTINRLLTLDLVFRMRNKSTGAIEKWFGSCTDVHEAVEARSLSKRLVSVT